MAAACPRSSSKWLEASAPESSFVDLWEFGHRYTTKSEFLDGYDAIKNGAKAVTADPVLYSAKVQAGFSLRLDYAPPGSRWRRGRPDQNYFSPARFQTALQAALEVSERYVWIYSEKNPRVFPPTGVPKAYLQAIIDARKPLQEPVNAHP